MSQATYQATEQRLLLSDTFVTTMDVLGTIVIHCLPRLIACNTEIYETDAFIT